MHVYLDYCITFLLIAFLAMCIFGEVGPSSPNSFEQLTQPNGPAAGFAILGGALLMLGNLSLQYGIALVGLTVCLPMQASLTVAIGEQALSSSRRR